MGKQVDRLWDMKQTDIHDDKVPGPTLIQRQYDIDNALPHLYDRHASAIGEEPNIVGADPNNIHSFDGEDTGGRDSAVACSIEVVRELIFHDRGERARNEIVGAGCARPGKACAGSSALYISMGTSSRSVPY